MKRFIKSFMVIMIAIGAIGCFFMACSREQQGIDNRKDRQQSVVPVKVAPAVMKDVPITLATFGIVRADSSVPIKAEIGGALIKVDFREGQNVKAGDLLFTIDPRPYKAALDQAQANLLRDKAQEENALINAERAKELVKKGFIARIDYDKAQTDAKVLSAIVRADEAALVNARLQLDRCSIRSPINGRTGELLVDEGTLVKPNDVILVTINRIHPIEVSFSVPQSYLPSIQANMARHNIKVQAAIPNDGKTPEAGKLTFINNTVDQNTGTVKLSALFQNESERLWPGQYVNVSMILDVRKDAVMVPSEAVQTGRDGKYLFVVTPDNTAQLRPVTVGTASGTETIIENGLKACEQVVTDGQVRLVPGARVVIKPEAKPPDKTASGRS